jgi:subtilase family serine protease
MIVADSSDQVVESDETNNVKTVNIPPPDLVVQDITFSPAEASVGDNLTIAVTIKNQGSGRADSSRLTCYIDDVARGYQDVSVLDTGATATKTFTWGAEAGQHIIKAVADFSNQITESNETNNELTVTFSTLSPDLVVQDISWSMENPLISDNMTFISTIKNQGKGRAGRSQLTYYIDNVSKGYLDVPEIKAGDIVAETFCLSVWTGSHTVKVVADSGNQVTEIDESNNEKTLDFSITKEAADLTGKTASTNPQGKGFMEGSWWLFFIAAVVLSGVTLIATMKYYKR